jgi:hypothetical protein
LPYDRDDGNSGGSKRPTGGISVELDDLERQYDDLKRRATDLRRHL